MGITLAARYGDQLAVATVDAVTENRELAALILQTGEAFRAMSAEMHGRD